MNILFFGGHHWEKGAWFRKQQFASRLAKRGHKVFYVEDSVSMLKKKAADSNKYLKTEIKQFNENLNIITPSALFPLPRNPISRRVFNLKLIRDIKKIFRKREITDFLFWFNRIELSSILGNIQQTKIFDLCDDLPFYQKLAGDEKGYVNALKYVKDSMARSSHQIVSAVKLKEKYQKYASDEIIIVPNGHNININEREHVDISNIVKDIKKPIVGFIGTLFRFIDDDLLKFIISSRPEYSFVFIGGVESNFPIQEIRNMGNVFLLGKQPKNLIPAIINSFDVCINPFKVHEVNDSVNPVKVFEYLAVQKKVISTFMYSLMKEKAADYILFAKNKEEFLSILDKTILGDLRNCVPADVIDSYHWDNLFADLISKLENKKIYL